MPRLISFSLKTSSAALTRSSVSACSVTPSSPAQAMLALVPRKSKRWESSLPAWFRALSTSWWSTLLTMSNDESAMVGVPPLWGRAPRHPGEAVRRSCTLLRYHCTAGCPSGQRERTVNPSAQPTKVRILHPPRLGTTAPALSGRGPLLCRGSGRGGRPGAGDGGGLQWIAAEEHPPE